MKKNICRIIIYVFTFIFLIIFLLSAYKITTWLIENNKNKEVVNKTKKLVKKDKKDDPYMVNFKELKKQNKDTVAYLKVNNTNIEYAVVQTNDNSFYLTHSFDKSYNTAGWPFLNYLNDINNDKNIIVFGHARKDGSMFGSLKNVLTEEWQNNSDNYDIIFITESGKHIYKVFSTYKVPVEDYYITSSFESDKTYEEFLSKIKERSLKKYNVDLSVNDKILTLSTCASDNKYRIVLHAKFVN